MIAVAEKIYTLEEYFELEKTSEIRCEFVHGKLIPMPGESKTANKIALNCARKLYDALEDKGFEIFTHDVRLIVKERAIYRYPDLVVAPDSDEVDTHAITQPILIIEVLSGSTASEDQGAKLREYSNLPSLKYYLIISQDEQAVEMYSRTGKRWFYDFFSKPSDNIELSDLSASLSMNDIYQKVKFENKPKQ